MDRRSFLLTLPLLTNLKTPLFAEGDWEITDESEEALDLGLEWLAKTQGNEGNWGTKHLGLVGLGALAFLAAGHMPGRGKYGNKNGRYGDVVGKALAYLTDKSKPSGLLNIDQPNRDMYNHGLATFVLGQAHGMIHDPKLAKVLDLALQLIYQKQAKDGGWKYEAVHSEHGSDLSLAVMQAKAIRSAMDSGLNVPTSVIRLAIQNVREHYKPDFGGKKPIQSNNLDDPRFKQLPGQFTYEGRRVTTAMAAAGVVCLQEFGQYDDWRIPKNMDYIRKDVLRACRKSHLPRNKGPHNGAMPLDAYTLYYVGQALYQTGGEDWKLCYPLLRNSLVNSQRLQPEGNLPAGSWEAGKWVSGMEAKLYGTSVASFILAMPNRYLPILQEGRIESVRKKVGES